MRNLLLAGLLLAAPALHATVNPLSVAPPSTAAPAGTPAYVWLTDDMQKIRQDSTSGINAIGPNQGLTIYCNRNETCSFQTMIQVPAGGISAYQVNVASCTQSVAPFTVISSGTVAPDVLTHEEFYIRVDSPSSTGNAYYGVAGTFPDALMYQNDPQWGQATLAFPANLTAGNNQGAWTDVHIPANAPSGWYSCPVNVSSGAVLLAQLPVVIGVWQYVMPSTATLKTIVAPGFAALCAQQYGAAGSDREAGCAKYTGNGANDLGASLVLADFAGAALNERISGAYLYEPANDPSASSLPTYWAPWLAGTAGRFPLILKGAKLNSFQYSPLAYNATTAGTWQAYFNGQGYGPNVALPYDKQCDENSCSPAQFITKATATLAGNPPMATMWTTSLQYNTGTNATNFLTVPVILNTVIDPIGGPLQTPLYAVFLASAPTNCGTPATSACPTRELWSYDDCVSEGGNCTNGTIGGVTGTWGNKHIDGKAPANRIAGWLAFGRFQTKGDLYFDATYCWDPFSFATCSAAPFAGLGLGNPWKFMYYSGGQGDGTLWYSGISSGTVGSPATWLTGQTITFAGGVGVSTPTYVPSIRVKLWRDTIQDYELLNQAHLMGLDTLVAQTTTTFMTNGYTFNTSTAPVAGTWTGTLTGARITIGQAIQALYFPPGPTITSASSLQCYANQSCSYQITATGSPTSYGAANLPSGLSVNSGSGLISGTPTVAGFTVATSSATNALGTGTAPLNITVTAGSMMWH